VIEGLRPYADLVATGLPWLPAVPAHWEVRRSKYLAREVDQRSVTGEETHLSMNQRLGLVPSSESTQRRLVSESYVGGKLVAANDLVLNRLKAHLGIFAYARQPGVISPDYSVFRPEPSVDVRYLEFVLKSPACRGELRTRTKGIVEGFWRLYTDDFYDIRLPQPPLEEQRLIVRFLDWHGGMTARLIRAKKRLIALLNEQKQAIIHHAVTRGLDPAAPLKPSGVDWLGDVPEGWEVLPLKRLASFKSGAGFPVGEQGGKGLEIPFLKVSDMNISGNERYIRSWNNSISRESAIALGAYIFPEKAIIFPKVGGAMLTNKRRILQQESCIDNNVMGCVANNCDLNFLFLSLEKIDLGEISKPGPVPAIGEGEVREIRIAVPPIEEQHQITVWLRQATGDLEHSIETVLSEIALIQEFRTRLTADVVTGQLDVRVLAATLPAVTAAAPPGEPDDDAFDEAADALEDEEANA
jgi:type I restriction enzyme, S subunit